MKSRMIIGIVLVIVGLFGIVVVLPVSVHPRRLSDR